MSATGSSAGAAGPVPARRIRILDSVLANQIAAGEVVERPASVLKELIENALDAGATRIEVLVERGGAARIRVRDNGCGMHRDDLALALARHATSKIATLAELEALVSMGFRGEALPSIASVSRLRMDSREAGADTGWSLQVDGGEPRGAPVPSPHTPGTTVEVRDLFFNTPARRRFLRTERTEARHLELVFRRLALARMDVAMSLEHNGRSLLRLSRANDERSRRGRLARVLGGAFLRDALPVSHQVGTLRVDGWLGGCAAARERPDMQHLYVNQRPVSDAMVRHAVRLAHGDRLGAGQHPAWVLFLHMDPRQLDVNVHPSKLEVRFHEARMVHDFLRQAVARALGESAPRRSLPGATAPPRAVSESRSTADAPEGRGPHGTAPPSLRGLALLQGQVLLCQRGERVLLARAGDLLGRHVVLRLREIAAGQAPASRPLLLPERFEAPPAAGRALEAGLRVLQALGIRLRPGEDNGWTLLEIPACLAQLPACGLCRALCQPPGDPARAEDWIQALSRAADGAPLRDMAHGVELVEALAEAGSGRGGAPWRELDTRQLQALLGDGGGP